jgi:4-hydroxy-tetrahydrodipicolinate reductase
MTEGRGNPFISPSPKKQTIAGTRGGIEGGVNIHSVRLPGLVAHQEVIFGAPGETLTIRHDTYHRESFMPGVIMAIREVIKRNDYTYGLDRLLGLT